MKNLKIVIDPRRIHAQTHCMFLRTVAILVLFHHSMAMFDSDKTVTYTGTVTKFSYTNPHIYVFADIQKDGKPVNYRLEGAAPYSLKQQGWSATALRVGDRIRIVAHPTKDNTNFGLL